MTALIGFDASQVDPNTGFDPIPGGNYEVVVVSSEDKPVKSGSGRYLQFELEVISGEFKGRKIWERLMLAHSNPVTVKIARAKLSSLCRACGVMQPKDSCELHNLPIVAKVKLKRRKDNDEPANEIVSFDKREGTTVPAKPIQATSDTPPWMRQSRDDIPS